MDVLFETNDGKLQFDQNKEVCLLVKGGMPSAENKAMLEAMMKAIKVDMNQVDLVAYEGKLETIPKHATIIILFGVSPGSLSNIELKLNQSIHLEHNIVLPTFSLDDLQQDKSKKMVLWKTLQSTFLN